MTHTVRLSQRATRDIEQLLEYSLEAAPMTAQLWYQRLQDAIASLEDLPLRCSLASESRELGQEIRELIFGKRRGALRILFVVDGATVHVLHVRRASRGAVTLDDLQ